MDFGPYYDTGLIGPNGKLLRLHKGGAPKPPPPVVAPAQSGAAAMSVSSAKDRDPNRRVRGAQGTILSTGMNNNFGRKSILGG